MLSVLLKILMVLGIIILLLLGIVLFLVLIILFLPITYRLEGRFDDLTEKEVHAKINWLFGMLRLKVVYSKSLNWNLKFLWFDLKASMEKKKNSSKTEQKISTTVKDSTVQQVSKDITSNEEENITLEENMSYTSQNTEKSDILNDQQSTENVESRKDKLTSIWEKITYYINILREDDTKNLLSRILRILGKILRSIRPRKVKMNGIIGFDSPDTTGKIYGFICMLYPYYGKDIHIIPDFEQSVLKGNIYIKGHIYIIFLVIGALRILLDRRFFKIIRKLKNGGTSKNGR